MVKKITNMELTFSVVIGFVILYILKLFNVQNMKKTDSEHFKFTEFNCKNGTEVPREYWGKITKLQNNLEILRTELGNVPIIINSAYRTPAYNKSIGGVWNSQHLLGEAVDLTSTKVSAKQIFNAIKKLIVEGKIMPGQVIYYEGRNFVHYGAFRVVPQYLINNNGSYTNA